MLQSMGEKLDALKELEDRRIAIGEKEDGTNKM